jgi:hypothetical protein
MGIRSTVGSMLESTIGRERLHRIRKAERKARNTLAKRLATVQPKRPPEAGRDGPDHTRRSDYCGRHRRYAASNLAANTSSLRQTKRRQLTHDQDVAYRQRGARPVLSGPGGRHKPQASPEGTTGPTTQAHKAP